MKVRYKYNFWRVMGEKYPGPQNQLDIKKKLQQDTGLSYNTLNKYMNLRHDEDRDVPAWFLLRFSVRFGVELKDLINYDLPRQTFEKESEQLPKSLAKLGMTKRKF